MDRKLVIIPKAEQKLIYLKWQDAHSNGSWFTEEEITKKIKEEAFISEEVGWVIFEDDKEIHLCGRRGTWDKKQHSTIGEYGQYQRIPKTWILQRKVIEI